MGLNPLGVAVGDFDRDGHQDLATNNSHDGTVTIWFHAGDAGGARRVDIVVPAPPGHVAAADLDGDGWADLVTTIATYPGGVYVLYNLHDGTFGRPATLTVNDFPFTVSTADWSGDGIPDLATADAWNGTVSLLRNRGGGEFDTVRTLTVGGYPFIVKAGDLGADGGPEILIGRSGCTALERFRWRGAAGFEQLPDITTRWEVANATLCDLDLDGDLDLAVPTDEGTVSVLLNDGAGHFPPPADYPAGAFPASVVPLDLDGDGLPDLVATNFGGSSVSVLRNRGGGLFAPGSDYAAGGGAALAAGADFDGDGRTDVCVPNFTDHSVSLLRGDGLGGLAAAKVYSTASVPTSVAHADLNRDGLADVVVATPLVNRVAVLFGRPDGGLSPLIQYSAGESPSCVLAGDLNGDALPDVVALNYAGGSVSVLRNLGAGVLASPVDYGVGSYPIAGCLGDVDGDGDLDLVVANVVSNDFSLLLNRGDGTFAPEVRTRAPESSPSGIVLEDADSDGDLDLAVACWGGGVHFYLNRGSGTFDFWRTLDWSTGYWAVDLADLDGDSNAELLAVWRTQSTLFCFYDAAHYNFRVPGFYSIARETYAVTHADLDDDGLIDVATLAFGDGSVTLLRNQGGGALQPAAVYPCGSAPYAFALADLTADGRPDLVVASGGARALLVLEKTGAPLAAQLAPEATSPEPPGRPATAWRLPPRGRCVPCGTSRSRLNRMSALPSSRSSETDAAAGQAILRPPVGPWGRHAPAPERAEPVRALADSRLRFGDLSFPVGGGPISVACGRFDRYPGMDLATVDADRSLSVVPNPLGPPQLPLAPTPLSDDPAFVAAGDLDGDGFDDLAATFSATNRVGIFHANGDGSFAAPVYYDTGLNPIGIVVADIDGDGAQDVVVADYEDNAVSFLRNQGGGRLAKARTIVTGSGPIALAVSDLDGDGDPEIVTADSRCGSVSILENLGDGNFSWRKSYSLSGPAYGVTVADLDHDGQPDLAVLAADRLVILHNEGHGAFAERASRELREGPGDLSGTVVAADLNRDGCLDLVLSVNGGEYRSYLGARSWVSVFFGDGNGGIAPAVDYFAGERIAEVAAADLDGDGDVDVAYADFGSTWDQTTWWNSSVHVLTNRGTGDLAGPRSYSVDEGAGSWVGRIAIVRDGRQGRKLVLQNGANLETTRLLADGRLADREPVTIGRLQIARDLNGDGLLDLVLSSSDSVDIMIALPAGGFDAPEVHADGAFLTLGDFNGDGLPDIGLGPGQQVRYLPNLGNGQFGPPVVTDLILDWEGDAQRVISLDADRDGLADLLAAARGQPPLLRMFRNLDGVHFDSPREFPLWPTPDYLKWSSGAVDLVAADLDQDGFLDVSVLTAEDWWRPWVTIMRGAGDGGFAFAGDFTTEISEVSNHAVADFDGDHIPDIVVSHDHYDGASLLRVARGLGDGHFALGDAFETGRSPVDCIGGDLDGDGRVDIVTSNGTYWPEWRQEIEFYPNLGDPGIPTEVLISRASLDMTGDRVRIAWHVAAAGGTPVRFERATAGSEWSEISSGSVDGTGMARFEDAHVSPGTRYGYRLTLVASGVHSDETWVAVPVAAAFALIGPGRNPTSDEALSVRFGLPDQMPATLELMDLNGRSVRSREVGNLGPGIHEVRMDPGRRLPAGIYWLRLRQGARHSVLKIAVIG